MSINDKFEVTADVGAATAKALTITWTTNDPTASTAATVADGDAVASTETGVILKSMNAQIAAILVDIAAIRTSINT